MRITVTRPFLLRAERQEVGTVLDLADALARELVYVGKAEPVVAVPPPAGPAGKPSKPAKSAPMTVASTPALVVGAAAAKPGAST